MEIPGLRGAFEAFRSHRRAAAGVAIAGLIAGTLRAAKGLRASGHPPSSNADRWHELTPEELADNTPESRLHVVPDQEPTAESDIKMPTDTIAS